MAHQVELSVKEGLAYAQSSAYWEGFAAGVKAAAQQANELALAEIMRQKEQAKADTPEPLDELTRREWAAENSLSTNGNAG